MKLTTQRKQYLAREARRREGIELTPDQAEAALLSAIRKIRDGMVAKGHAEFATMNDAEVRQAMHEAMA